MIHHSGKGVQYALHKYIDELKGYGFQIGTSLSGNPYGNAIMGSFFKTLKYEEVNLYEYDTIADVRTGICALHRKDLYLLKTSFSTGIKVTR